MLPTGRGLAAVYSSQFQKRNCRTELSVIQPVRGFLGIGSCNLAIEFNASAFDGEEECVQALMPLLTTLFAGSSE